MPRGTPRRFVRFEWRRCVLLSSLAVSLVVLSLSLHAATADATLATGSTPATTSGAPHVTPATTSGAPHVTPATTSGAAHVTPATTSGAAPVKASGASGQLTASGSSGPTSLDAPVVGMTSSPNGSGYWLAASDGSIASFGVPYLGSMGGTPLAAPVVGMVATRTGGGYWEVGSDGGIFAFGNAGFFGSMGGQHLNRPVVGMAADPTDGGYWEVASDGGIFAFGNAGFFGSTGGQPPSTSVVGIAPAGQDGYWEADAGGGVYSYGGAQFDGSASVVTAHSYLPPQNPPANIPADPNYFSEPGSPCWQGAGTPQFTALPTSSQCVAQEVEAIDAARAQEGMGPVQLPSNFVSLSPEEQLFVLADIERVSRGEQPILGLSSLVDGYAQKGALAGTDPSFDFSALPSTAWWGSNWAGGVINALDASYTWMYNDGWGGTTTYNVDCTSPTAPLCWGHRDNILTTQSGSLVMGAGYGAEASGVASLAEILVAVGSPSDVPPLYYTWSDAVAAGAGA